MMPHAPLPQGPSQNLGFLRGLDSQTTARLLEGAELIHHRHRDHALQAGEPAEHFALVASGCYKLLKPGPQGTRTLLAFAAPGDPIGLLVMAPAQASYPVSAQSLGESSLLWIPRETYLRHWLREPEVIQKMHIAIMNRCLGFHSDRALQHLALPGRIAGFLLRCLDHYEDDNPGALRYPLTRREISEAVGSQTESVIRIMSAWQKSGWIATSDRHIEILQPDKLAEFITSGDGP